MYLLIDAGNSRLKWLFGRTIPTVVEALSYRDNWQERLYRAWHLLPEPQKIALSSVNNPEVEEYMSALAWRLWQRRIYHFRPQKRTGTKLTVAYERPETLGTDRYLAMLGARDLCGQALVVVGCGTAITFDAVDSDGQHLGGFILPGIRMAENALLNHTQRLVPMRWTANFLGKDTATCIGAGIHHALPAGVEGLATELEQQRGYYFQRFAFGGDASILFSDRPNYQLEPDLIFRGMLANL